MSKTKLVDMTSKVVPLGAKLRIEEDIPSENGMLYLYTMIRLDEVNYDTEKVRVVDAVGKVWWIEPFQVSCSLI